MHAYDEGFRYDLKYQAVNAFEHANPKVFTHACIDPSAMEKLTAMENALDTEKAEYNSAAFESRSYRIASETLAIVDERMVINQSPRPPSWAENGRGGLFDPRTIYRQASSRIDLKDEAYNNQIEDYRHVAREKFAQEAISNQQEKTMPEELSPLDQLKHDVLGIVGTSNEKRKELNVWYGNYKDALIAEQTKKGQENAEEIVLQAQRERVNKLTQDTENLILQKFDAYGQSQTQAQKNMQDVKFIPEPPSMDSDKAHDQDTPDIGHEFLNGSEMEH